MTFDKFNKSKICGNIKGKIISYKPKLEKKKILTWKYSAQFQYFSHISLIQCWIDLILVAMDRELENLKLSSLLKLHNRPLSRPKPTWKLIHFSQMGIGIFIFFSSERVF